MCMLSWIRPSLRLNLSSFKKWFDVLQLVLFMVLGRSVQQMYLAESTQPFPRTQYQICWVPVFKTWDSFWLFLWCTHFWSKTVVKIHIKKGKNFSKKKAGTKNSCLCCEGPLTLLPGGSRQKHFQDGDDIVQVMQTRGWVLFSSFLPERKYVISGRRFSPELLKSSW